MPLPLTADSLDAIPEAVRGAYVEKAGKFVLDAEIPDVAGLKSANATLLAEKKAALARAAIIGDRTAEEIQADFEYAAKAREDAAKAAGNYEELKKIQAQEIAKRDKALADLTAARQNDHKQRVVTEAVASAGGKVKKLLDPVSKFVQVVEQDGQLVEQVVDAKGKVRIMDGQGRPMTVAELVDSFKADDDYANDFAAPAASGGGARNNGTNGGTGAIVMIPKDASTQEYRRLKADAEKRGVAYQIAS